MASQENEDEIRKVLYQNPDGLSFNKLKKASGMSTSTQSFVNAINNMKDRGEVSSWKDGNKTMFSFNFCEVCNEKFGEKIAELFKQENSWQKLKSKTQRSTSFIHFLHQISSDFLAYMIMYVFEDHENVYRVCLNRLEQKLNEQKKLLQKSFSRKEKQTMFEELLFINNYENQRSKIIRSNVQKRKQKRTLDEISRDLEDYVFFPSPKFKMPTINLKPTNLTKNPKARKKYQHLEKKYYDLKTQMLDTGYELDQIS